MSPRKQLAKAALCVWLLPACLFAQQTAAAPTPAPVRKAAKFRRWPVGFRIELVPGTLFDTGAATSTTTKPAADYAYESSTKKLTVTGVPTIEHCFTERFSLGLEFRFHHVRYTQTTEMLSGRVDPNANYDDRIVNTFIADTRARYWEVPMVARYLPFGGKGLFSRTYLVGGAEYRRVASVVGTFSNTYADGTSDTTGTAPKPVSANQLGFIAGIGMRSIDDAGLRIMPEARFVRWRGTTFQGPSYHSAVNQIEVGLGFSF